jgi:hypothetical protein
MKYLIPLLLLPALSLADPGPATRYLIDESASLLDLGVLRTELRLAASADSFKKIYEESSGVEIVSLSTAVVYDYQDDRLSIEITPLVRESGRAEKGCKDLLTASHAWLLDVVPKLFGHKGYKSDNQPEDLQEEIAERTFVYCMAQDYARRSNIVSVRLPLASGEIGVIRHNDNQ